MNPISNFVLTPPAPFFGAVKGERKLSRRWFVWTAVAVLIVILAATSKPMVEVFHIPVSDVDNGMYPTMWVFVVVWVLAWLGYTDTVLSAHEKKYAADIKRLKREYINKEVRPYLGRKYDAKISEDTAYSLFVGYSHYLTIQGKKLQVRLDGMTSVTLFAMGEIAYFYPEDLILEEIIEPAATRFVPLKPVV